MVEKVRGRREMILECVKVDTICRSEDDISISSVERSAGFANKGWDHRCVVIDRSYEVPTVVSLRT